MHAYLIVGEDAISVQNEVQKLVKKLQAKILEFPLSKIDDARELGKFTRLSLNKPTAIILNGVEDATEEALNAFLKNLEEPQENLYYLLTARAEGAVLPTIASRCQIIRIGGDQKLENQTTEIMHLLKMGMGEKLAYVDKLKKREEAVAFLENFIYVGHKLLHQAQKKHLLLVACLKAANLALTRIKANGNVNLHLTNLVLSLV